MNTTSPWITNGTRQIYDNPWISVREDAVTQPDGQPGIYGVVHFLNRAIAIVPIDSDGFTWLVGQFRYTLDSYSWEVPEGGVPIDEDLEQGARRELAEEVGVTAAHCQYLGQFHLSNSVSDEQAHVFVAWDLTAGQPQPEGTEQLEQMRLSLDDAVGMADRGEITDILSVVALARAQRWWNQRLASASSS